jgi:P4 family phage/plasmid primase-like protien
VLTFGKVTIPLCRLNIDCLCLCKVYHSIPLGYSKFKKREYWMRSLATAMHGSRLSRDVLVWLGSGRNGKTVIATLVEEAFGDYFIELPSAYLQRVLNALGPDPMTLELRGKRIVIVSEPEKSGEIKSDTLKRITGGDRARARGMFAKGPLESFQLNLHVHVLANKRPPIDGTDGGIKDRIKLLPFLSKFVDRAEDIDETKHKYQADEDLKTGIRGYADGFIWLLVNRYYEHTWDGSMPEEVREATAAYLNANDPLSMFISERCVMEQGKKLRSRDLEGYFEGYLRSKKVELADWKDQLRFAVMGMEGVTYKASVHFGKKQDGKLDVTSGYENLTIV